MTTKTAYTPDLWQSVLEPKIQQWMDQRGLAYRGFDGDRNILDVNDSINHAGQAFQAELGSTSVDTANLREILAGLNRITGLNAADADLDRVAGLAGKIAPYAHAVLGQRAEPLMSALGLQGPLAGAIQSHHHYAPMKPEQAQQLAEKFGPALNGFTPTEFGQLLPYATGRYGWMSLQNPGSVDGTTKALMAMKQRLASKGMHPSMDQLTQSMAQFQNMHRDLDMHGLADKIGETAYYDRLPGGEGGAFGAALQSTGRVTGIPGAALGAEDERLRQRALDSRGGREMAWKTRMENEFPGQKLSPYVQSVMRMQKAYNRTFMHDPEIDAVRGEQSQDFAPMISQVNKTYKGDTPQAQALRRGAMSERLGHLGIPGGIGMGAHGAMTPLEQAQTFFDPAVTSQRQAITQQAREFGKNMANAGTQSKAPVRALFDAMRTSNTVGGVLQDTLGIPKSSLPESPEPIPPVSAETVWPQGT